MESVRQGYMETHRVPHILDDGLPGLWALWKVHSRSGDAFKPYAEGDPRRL